MPNYFTFTLGRNTDEKQNRVTVFKPAKTTAISGYSTAGKPSNQVLLDLLFQLTTDHILTEPNPTRTLVSDENSNRIDTQPANHVFRNIHFQAGRKSYAVVTVEIGGELCYVSGYQNKLLGYIKYGLGESFIDGFMYNIGVKIEKKKRRDKDWDTIASKLITHKLCFEIITYFEERLKIRSETVTAKRTAHAINAEKIVTKVNAIEHVVVAIQRGVAKAAEKVGAHAVAKTIPAVSTILGVFLDAQRVGEGNWIGAIGELLSGVSANIPGAGTVLSLGIDAALLIADIKQALDNEREHKRLLEEDVKRLQKERIQIRREIEELSYESQIYGCGNEGYFDESGLADLDDITQIRIRCGDLIDAIQVVYRNQSGAQHGGNGGESRTFDLEPHERITLVSLTVLPEGAISSLTFCTDNGREQTFGTRKGEISEFEMTDGSYLGAIKGYNLYTGGRKNFPGWDGKFQLLPAIGFIPKYKNW